VKYTIALLLVGSGLSGCGTDPATAQKIADLEARIAKIEAAPPAAAGPAGARPAQPPVDQEREKAAAVLLKDANTAYEGGDYPGTRTKIEELKKDFGDTRAAKAADRILEELDVIGKDAGTLQVEKWYQGDTTMANGEATLLVFWEVWCPHCKREVPKIESTYQKYKDQGLNIIGLTKQSRNITEEQVTEFLSENKVSYPIAKEMGDAVSMHFGVKGIPAAAVVKDGKVVWRGHPARINDQMIEGWIK
jgi:thiol-disulfide isomerase/thioredoxin